MEGLGHRLQQYLLALLGQTGGTKLFIIAMFDSSFLSLPEVNDFLIIALSIKNPSSMLYYCLMTTLGSIAGCLLLYVVGRRGGEILVRRKFSKEKVERVYQWYQKYGVLAVTIPSILPPPTPFKIFVLSAGAFQVSVGRFILAITVGRGFRYFLEGFLAIQYGEKARDYMQHNYPTAAITVVVIILLGVLAYYLMRRFRQFRSRRIEG
jgi:membrane protein YqaA with SNARE-associated domain